MRACLAVVFVALSAPTGAWAEGAKPVTKTYPVADLVTPLPDLTPAATPPRTTEAELIRYLTAAAAPQSWRDAGGAGRIDFYPVSMALVVHATPAVQEEVARLLDALRAELDRELTVQYQLVAVPDAAFAKLGLVELTAPRVCGVRYKSLDDAAVERLMRAAQDHPDTEVMTAPKVMLFDGQRVSLNVTDKQYFVTRAEVRTVDGRPVVLPVNECHELGLKAQVRAGVTPDRKSVAIDASVSLVGLEAERVPLCPVTIPVAACDEAGRQTGAMVPFTQYVQHPKLARAGIDGQMVVPVGETAVAYAGHRTRMVERAFARTTLGQLAAQYLGGQWTLERRDEHVLVLVTPRLVTNVEAGGQ